MALTDIAVRNAKPGAKVIRLKDEGGLHLEINPKGGKYWRYRYWMDSRERLISFGVYPTVSLKLARERRDEARLMIARGEDPGEARKEMKAAKIIEEKHAAETFEVIAREWHARQATTWVEGHSEKVIRRLELYLFPWLGPLPIREIEAPALLEALRRVEAAGRIETAHRALQTAGQVFRYAVATGRASRDVSGDLRGALTPSKEIHRAAILDPREVGGLLRSIDSYPGSLVVRAALRFAPLTFVRPGELRQAEWSEIDFESEEWRIPAAKMKMREQHIIPLSRQAVAVLREIQPVTSDGRYVFPSERTRNSPMSNAAVLAALRRMGYEKTEMSGHGFRAMASTLLHEQGWNSDIIERQLAHAERNKVKAAYNRAQYLKERRRMMQAWADYLDSLRTGARVTPIRAAS